MSHKKRYKFTGIMQWDGNIDTHTSFCTKENRFIHTQNFLKPETIELLKGSLITVELFFKNGEEPNLEHSHGTWYTFTNISSMRIMDNES